MKRILLALLVFVFSASLAFSQITRSAGVRGSTWFNGSGAPGTITGQVNDDYYLNVTNGDVYQLQSGAWTNIGNIRGGAPAEVDANIIYGASGSWAAGTALPNGITATTQTAADNSTKVATTAYVDTGLALKADLASPTFTGIVTLPLLATTTRCASAASPAVCAAAPSGFVTIAAAATTIVVDTTAVTANSQIFVTNDESLGTALSVTCNTQGNATLGAPRVTARVAGTSFTIAIDTGPTTNPECLSYWIVN